MTIGGQTVRTPRLLAVENPATGHTFAHAPICTPEQLDDAVSAATAAGPAWAALTHDERRDHLRACREALVTNLTEIADVLSLEQGKPLADARAEVELSADWFEHTAALSLPSEPIEESAQRHVTVNRVPHGVVAAIAPSNFPLILAVCKVAPALLAGNTVVLKPSPQTPLSTLLLGESLNACLPAGVLNVVSGDNALGELLCTHTSVQMISFTGSVETGMAIASQAAARLLPVVLELGGNDPAIVLPGADIASIAPALFGAAMANNGQFCAAVKRVFVSRKQAAELTQALSRLAIAAVVGDGRDPSTQFGPLISRSQRDRLAAMVDAAVAAGAKVVTGGRPIEGPGHFYQPTIVVDLPPGTELELEEQFGPVVPIIAYDSLPEAVIRANATDYGLGASVWGDEALARDLSGQLHAGIVWINTHGDLRHDTPFGGTNRSGRGVEYGRWGLLEYTRIKVLNVMRG
ncbi:aldehyde dehydrogenase family protein [Micromonospora sp. NPDC000089]|uniref:aldehyde dehydrogenase family protein n=1 Tax=unclassified Micromonospora TaxID=2617518 RepID=UPI0036C3639F